MNQNISNSNEKFLLMILCSQAKLENDNKEALMLNVDFKDKVEMGLWPCPPPSDIRKRKERIVNAKH